MRLPLREGCSADARPGTIVTLHFLGHRYRHRIDGCAAGPTVPAVHQADASTARKCSGTGQPCHLAPAGQHDGRAHLGRKRLWTRQHLPFHRACRSPTVPLACDEPRTAIVVRQTAEATAGAACAAGRDNRFNQEMVLEILAEVGCPSMSSRTVLRPAAPARKDYGLV